MCFAGVRQVGNLWSELENGCGGVIWDQNVGDEQLESETAPTLEMNDFGESLLIAENLRTRATDVKSALARASEQKHKIKLQKQLLSCSLASNESSSFQGLGDFSPVKEHKNRYIFSAIVKRSAASGHAMTMRSIKKRTLLGRVEEETRVLMEMEEDHELQRRAGLRGERGKKILKAQKPPKVNKRKKKVTFAAVDECLPLVVQSHSQSSSSNSSSSKNSSAVPTFRGGSQFNIGSATDTPKFQKQNRQSLASPQSLERLRSRLKIVKGFLMGLQGSVLSAAKYLCESKSWELWGGSIVRVGKSGSRLLKVPRRVAYGAGPTVLDRAARSTFRRDKGFYDAAAVLRGFGRVRAFLMARAWSDRVRSCGLGLAKPKSSNSQSQPSSSSPTSLFKQSNQIDLGSVGRGEVFAPRDSKRWTNFSDLSQLSSFEIKKVDPVTMAGGPERSSARWVLGVKVCNGRLIRRQESRKAPTIEVEDVEAEAKKAYERHLKEEHAFCMRELLWELELSVAEVDAKKFVSPPLHDL